MRRLNKIFLILIALLLLAVLSLTVLASESGESSEPSLKIEAANLSFKDEVSILYAVSAEGAELTEVKLLVWTKAGAYVKGTEDYVLESVREEVVDGVACAVFDYDKMAAKNMTDAVYARAYAEVGGTPVYSDVVKYSVVRYAHNKLGYTGTATESETLKATLESLLEYGASAQQYFDYNTSRLATSRFYKVTLEGGFLSDGSANGLYLPGDEVTLAAPSSNDLGEAFAGWFDNKGRLLSSEALFTYTVGSENATITAMYGELDLGTEGLVYQTQSDGSYYVSRYNGSATSVVIPAVYNGKAVTGIYSRAFYNTQITSVAIPDSVVFIGSFAFSNCTGLTEIKLSNNLETIDKYAFSGCSALTRLSLPDSLTAIYDSAFYNCNALEYNEYENGRYLGNSSNPYVCLIKLDYEYGVTPVIHADTRIIYEEAFRFTYSKDKLVIPDKVVYIGTEAFGFSNFESIYIPASVRCVGEGIFLSCDYLTGIEVDKNNPYLYSEGNCIITKDTKTLVAGCSSSVIPDGVEVIGKYAFSWLYGMTEINIPSTVKTVKEYAFYSIHNLAAVTISESVTSIDSQAFYNCPRIASISINDANPTYSSKGNCIIEKESKTLIFGGAGSVIPTDKSVTVIGSYAFYGNDSIKELVIPEGVEKIERWAFGSCSGLKTVTLPRSLTKIESYAFYSCSALTDVYYAGTEAEWEAILDTTGNDNLVAATVHYGSTGGDATEPDAPHTHSYGSWQTVKKATCTEDGERRRYCSCGESESETLKSPGHNYISVGINSYPTCTENGEEWFFCDNCSDIITLPIDALEHIYEIAYEVPAANCLEEGVRGWKCARLGCEASYEEKLSNGPHTEYIFPGTPPTCTASGYSDTIICTTCNTCLQEEEYLSPTGHSYTDWMVEIPNTCISGGTNVQKCHNCDAVWYGYSMPLGHSFEDGFCVRCGIEKYSEGLYYVSNNDGTCRVAGLGSCTDTNIVIPEYSPGNYDRVVRVDGIASPNIVSVTLPDSVTTIGYSAFGGCTSLESIKLSSSLTLISDMAFYNCTSLVTVIIPDGVTVIGEEAFAGCSLLSSINIPDGVTGIAKGCFDGCTSLAEVEISSGVEKIGDSAFSGCTALIVIVIPEGVTSIGNSAFASCTNLESVELHEGLETIGNNAFDGCSSLDNIVIPRSVYSIGTAVLRNCTALIVIVIKSNVATLPQSMLEGCSSLTDVTLPANVSKIASCAFKDCTALVSIALPTKLKSVGDSAFKGCSSLTSIIYSGSLEQWAAVTKGSGNECLENSYIESTGTAGEGHVHEWSEEELLPTCTAGGYYKRSCSCGATASRYYAALGHSFVDGKCTRCGSFKESEGFKFITDSDGNCYVSGIGTCTDTKIVIPSVSPAGYTVVGIYDNAFYGNTKIESVYIPSTVKTIGVDAFRKCTALETISIPESVTTIGSGAFSWCESLVSVALNAKITIIQSQTFIGCYKLESIDIPDTVTEIAAEAFRYCICLKEVNMTESVTLLGVCSFGDNDYNLMTINYAGTKAQWSKIKKEVNYIYDWKHNSIVEIICSDGYAS